MSPAALSVAISLPCFAAICALLAASGAGTLELALAGGFGGLMAVACAVLAPEHASKE